MQIILYHLKYSFLKGNIIESLDKLQQHLKLEEAVDERLETTNSNNIVEPIQNKSQKEVSTALFLFFFIHKKPGLT